MDPYSILGVSRTADMTTITKAYHRLLRQLHPDQNPDPSLKNRLLNVQLAYESITKGRAFNPVSDISQPVRNPTQPPRPTKTRPNDWVDDAISRMKAKAAAAGQYADDLWGPTRKIADATRQHADETDAIRREFTARMSYIRDVTETEKRRARDEYERTMAEIDQMSSEAGAMLRTIRAEAIADAGFERDTRLAEAEHERAEIIRAYDEKIRLIDKEYEPAAGHTSYTWIG